MSADAKHHPYALRLPLKEAEALARAQKKSGQSINRLIVQCVQRALPEIIATRPKSKRITNVDPLPDEVLDRIYSNPERDEQGLERFMKAQAFGGRD
ncbi:MAG TPA: hypothetical protein VGN23_09545 [Verrucomicrobiae bacterium]|jgi:hypothetical protein